MIKRLGPTNRFRAPVAMAAIPMLLSACQTTAPIPEPPPLRYVGAVSWYQGSAQITYKPFKSARQTSKMTIDAVSGLQRLTQNLLAEGDIGCSAYGGDLLCRSSVTRAVGMENGKPQSFGFSGGYDVEVIIDKHGHSRAVRIVDSPHIKREDLDKMNEVVQPMLDRIFIEYPASGLRVGDKLVIATNKTVTGVDGKPFIYSCEGVVRGRAKDKGRDVIVFDVSGTQRQGAINAEPKGYFLVDAASGLVVDYRTQAYIREGASVALLEISTSID
jgi:hypothetical protein